MCVVADGSATPGAYGRVPLFDPGGSFLGTHGRAGRPRAGRGAARRRGQGRTPVEAAVGAAARRGLAVPGWAAGVVQPDADRPAGGARRVRVPDRGAGPGG